MPIFIRISNISIITGDNKWKSLKDYTIDIWKRYHFFDYKTTKNKFDKKLEQSKQNDSIKKSIQNDIHKLNIKPDIKNIINHEINKPIIDKNLKKNLINNIDKSINTSNNIKKLNVNSDIKNIIHNQIKNIKKSTDVQDIDKTTLHNDLKNIIQNNPLLNNSKNISVLSKNINEITNIINTETKKESIKRKILSCNEINTNKLECKKKFVKTETDYEKIKRIEKEQNIKINSKINVKSNDTKHLNNKKSDIIKSINNSKLSEKDKLDVKKSIENESNKRYGTIRENFTFNHLINIYGPNITIDKKHKIKLLFDNFYIIGEIDGLLNNDTIIEIKNRTNRLFNCIYNYEKVQIIMYMHLCGLKHSKLVENFNNQINIIDLDMDEDFLKYVLNKIYKFSKFYDELLKNIEIKRITLLGTDKEFKKLYNAFSVS